MANKKFDILIVGSGITGLSAACAFKALSLDVAIISASGLDLKEKSFTSERNFTIVESSRRFLDSVGIWKTLQNCNLGRYYNIKVWDSTSANYLRLDVPPGFDGPMGWVVPESVLIDTINSRVEDVARFYDLQSINDKQGTPITAKLANSEELESELILFTDSSFPEIRQGLNLDFKPKPYEQLGIVLDIKTEKSHGNVARQWFSKEGILAFLPKFDKDNSSVVFSVPRAQGNAVLSYDLKEVSEYLSRNSKYALGEVQASGSPKLFPLKRGIADSWIKERCLLAGGAAHVVHPLAGLGLNLSLMDVACLAECLDPSKLDKSWPSLHKLNYYNRWRKSESAALLASTEALFKFFLHPMFNFRKIRGELLKIFGKADFFKEKIVRLAMGLDGDLPSVAKLKRFGRKDSK